MKTVRIVHFSDVLCVWAYVSQVRIDELRRTFGEGVVVDCRFVSVFGDARGKIARNWDDNGGASAYHDHVAEIVGRFGHVELHPEVWRRDAPRSSLPSHLVLAAVRCLEAAGRSPSGSFDAFTWRVRQAFFRDGQDVSAREVLERLTDEAGMSTTAVAMVLDSGEAHAALAADLEAAREHEVRASPTLVFNEGRQRLTGNVGYRIIEANVRELIENPAGQHSWC